MTLLTTNYCKNPSFEVNVLDDWSDDLRGGSRTYDGTQYKVGTYSCKIIGPAADISGIYTTTGVSVPNGSTASVSAWVRCSANPAPDKVAVYVISSDWAISAHAHPTSAANGAWERVTVSLTNNTGIAKTFLLILYNLWQDVTESVWFDAAQLELASAPTQYTDGSLGGQCAWTGAAHNSTSTRTLAEQALAGAQTCTGTLSKLTAKTLAGSQTCTGTVGKKMMLAATSFTGAITFAGTLTKRAGKVLAGLIQWVGAVTYRGSIDAVYVSCVDEPVVVKAEQGDLTFKCPQEELVVKAPGRYHKE